MIVTLDITNEQVQGRFELMDVVYVARYKPIYLIILDLNSIST